MSEYRLAGERGLFWLIDDEGAPWQASVQPLAQYQDVWFDPILLKPPERTCAAKSYLNLVEHQKCSRRITSLPQLLQPFAIRSVHSSFRLHCLGDDTSRPIGNRRKGGSRVIVLMKDTRQQGPVGI